MINKLMPYAGLLKAAGVVLAIIAVVWWWSAHNKSQQQLGYDRAIADVRASQDKAAAAQRLREAGNFRKQEIAHEERYKTEQALAAARAAARAADQRLQHARQDFAGRLDAATRETAIAAARASAELLGECAGRYREVAFAADGHLADARLCRAAWPE